MSRQEGTAPTTLVRTDLAGMKSLIIKALLWIVGGSVVFVGSLFGFLAMQGRTSAQELARLPILSLFVAAPPDAKAEAAETAGGDSQEPEREASDDRATEALGTPPIDPSSERSTPAGARDVPIPAASDGLPFTPTELERMTTELREALAATSQRERALDERERALDRVAEDLEERRAQLERMLLDIENRAADVQDQRARFQREIVLLQEAEKENLRRLADKYSVMKADEAARVLAELEFGDIVKIVSQMSNDRQVGKILGAMNPELAASVTEKLMQLVEDGQEDR